MIDQVAQILYEDLDDAGIAWASAKLVRLEVGFKRQSWLILKDATGKVIDSHNVKLPGDGLWERIKQNIYTTATWISMTVELAMDEDGGAAVGGDFNYDERVWAGTHEGAPAVPPPHAHGQQEPNADDWAREFAMYPRKELPEWAPAAMEGASDRAKTVPSRVLGAVDTDYSRLHAAAAETAFYGALVYDAWYDSLRQFLGDDWSFKVNMVDSTICFYSNDDPTQGINANIHLIASIAPSLGTMLWGWAHPNGNPTGQAGEIRALGETDNYSDLTSAELNLPKDFNDLRDLINSIGYVSIRATGLPLFYPAFSGSYIVLALELENDSPVPLPSVTVSDFIRKMPRMLQQNRIANHRDAVKGLAKHAHFNVTEKDDTVNIQDDTGSADIQFDDMERIKSCEGTMGPGGAAA